MEKDKLQPMLVSKNMTIKQAMQRLNETAERILFVVDEKSNKLSGTVTDGDIRRGIINGKQFSESIETIANKNFIAITEEKRDDVAFMKQLVIAKEIEQIPVVNDSGVIVDVFLWTDLLQEKQGTTARTLHDNQVVIMAGGEGTRLDPFTKILPKALIPIGNKPVIEIIMEKFYRSGFHNFTYTLNYRKEYLKLFLKEIDSPYSIDWVEEKDFLGTAGGLSLLKEKLSETFFVTNCDSILDVDFERVLAWHKEYGSALTIIGSHNEIKIPFGVLELNDGKLFKISEKPVHDVIINTGVYVMEPHIVSYILKEKRLDMNELIEIVSEKENVIVYPIYGGWFDLGHWEEYRKNVKALSEL
jgi:dTDP-glucose pyrophosphorylase